MMCVECGQEAEGLIGGACAACFTRRTALMQAPEVLDLEICAHCHARHVGAHWQEPQAGTPEAWQREDAVREAVRVHQEVEDPYLEIEETAQDERNFAQAVTLQGHVQGVPVRDAATVLVRRTRSVCDRCSRIQGGFFAAILQLRATERDVSPAELETAHQVVASELDRLQASGNRFAFLQRSGAIHGGFDYYLGDIDAGRIVAKALKQRLGAKVQESAKLVGRRDGEDVHRVTFLVRIRPFTRGDFVLDDDRPYLVLAVHPKNLAVIDLVDRKRTRLDEAGLHRVGGPEMVEDAVVVAQEPSGVEVIDPRTQKTQTVLVDEDVTGQETVAVVRVEDRLYWVPTPSANNP